MHRGMLEMTSIIASASSSYGKDEHVARLLKMVPPQEYELSPATVRRTQGEEDGTVESRLEFQKEDCSVSSTKLKPEFRMILEKNGSQAPSVNGYKKWVKNLQNKVDEKRLNGIVLLLKSKLSKPTVEPMEFKTSHYGRKQKGCLEVLFEEPVLL